MRELLTKILTVKQIENLRPKAKPYEVLDGDGLHLTVRANGSKISIPGIALVAVQGT